MLWEVWLGYNSCKHKQALCKCEVDIPGTFSLNIIDVNYSKDDTITLNTAWDRKILGKYDYFFSSAF